MKWSPFLETLGAVPVVLTDSPPTESLPTIDSTAHSILGSVALRALTLEWPSRASDLVAEWLVDRVAQSQRGVSGARPKSMVASKTRR